MKTMQIFGVASVVIGFALLMGGVTAMNGSVHVPEVRANPIIGVAALALVLSVGVFVFSRSKA